VGAETASGRDYAQFLKETGFDFERDLKRITIAVQKRGQDSTLLPFWMENSIAKNFQLCIERRLGRKYQWTRDFFNSG